MSSNDSAYTHQIAENNKRITPMFSASKLYLNTLDKKLDRLHLLNIVNASKAHHCHVILGEILRLIIVSGHTINQTCLSKLFKLLDLDKAISPAIDLDNDEEIGLCKLALLGLLDEHTIELYAGNPRAFSAVKSMNRLEAKKKLLTLIDKEQGPLEPIDTIEQLETLSKASKITPTNFMIKAFGLPVIDSFEKIKHLSPYKGYPVFIEVINQCYFCEFGRYTLNQACFDKLVLQVDNINMQDDHAEFLILLAQSGNLNEENIETFAQNTKGFIDALNQLEPNDSLNLNDAVKKALSIINTPEHSSTLTWV